MRVVTYGGLRRPTPLVLRAGVDSAAGAVFLRTRNLGLFGIELKPGAGLNFTVEQG